MTAKDKHSSLRKAEFQNIFWPCEKSFKLVVPLALPGQLRACRIKLFTVVINYVVKYAWVFAKVSHFHPSLIFRTKLEPSPNGASYRDSL